MAGPTGTVTLLFTDIVGSSSLWEAHPGAMAPALERHDAVVREAIEHAGGHVFKTVGDSFCAAFDSALAAVAAAGAAQRALAVELWPDPVVLKVRIGLHTGVCEQRDGDYFGPVVNRVARLQAVAHGGQTVVSASTAALLRDVAGDFSLRDLGERRLKDLGRPEQVFQVDFAGLASEFPALASLDNPALANNLPALSASFVGRQRELAEVRSLVESSRLVTLTGSGGCGKTRLALQVAAELLDGSGDGVWLLELAAIGEEEAVAPAVAETLGIAPQPGRSSLDTLLDALSSLHVLLVLDNCEHLIGACAKLADAALRRCPQLHLLATSREPLGISGEVVYRVPSLALPTAEELELGAVESFDAVGLFLERARAQGVDVSLDAESAPLVVSLCRRLDGMPLAIELAAARLRSLSLPALFDRLDHRFRLLTGGSRSALPRQQTLRATVEWSYSLLNAAEQSLFRRLSVFADGFDLEAAEAVCALGDLEVFELDDLLGSLVDKSLVLAEPFAGALRYRLLETIRQFAAERLVDHDEPQAVALAAAHRAHYLALAERAAPQVTRRDQARWLSVLDAEQANLRRALEHAAAGDDGTSDVLRLVAALGRYWLIRVRADEVRSVLPLLEGTAGPEPRLLGKALISASLCVRHVEPAISRELAIRAVELARRLEDDQLLAESLWMLCATFYFAGDIAGADLAGSESVELARRLGDDQLLGESLAMLILPRSCSDPVGAWQLYAEAIACVERSGDRFLEALLRNNAGVHELAAGNLAAARSHLEAAHRAWEEVGSNVHHAALNLGWVFREEGDAARAAAMFEQARRVSRRSGDRHGIAYARLGLACLAADSGDGYQAGVLHGSAAALLASLGEPFVQPEEGYRLASLAALADQLGVGELERALAEGAALGVEGGELAPAAGHSPTIVTQRART